MVQGPCFKNHCSNSLFYFQNDPLALESNKILSTQSPWNKVSSQHDIRGLHNVVPVGVCSHNLTHPVV